ncbi:MAG: Flp pilus assembly complex ATPase component TadA [Lachnospiraceae bacterium]|nr:Flp pilus assembly complex ATPase component TadA [Lachnospiraceae bacterium]
MIDLWEILRTASSANASDIHLTAGIPPRMRVGGKLTAMSYPRLIPADTLEVVLAVMNEQQRERFEERGAYTLSFQTAESGRCRCSAYRQGGNVSLALRLIPERLPEPEELGIPDAVLQLGMGDSGLVLFAGTAGSGRTTAMASVIREINRRRQVHVVTLEDPVEFLHGHQEAVVSQREKETDFADFPEAMEAALREDADVIMTERLEDGSAVRAALKAADAGCLVLAPVYASGAEAARESLIGIFSEGERSGIRLHLADVLKAVVVLRRTDGADAPVVYQVY